MVSGKVLCLVGGLVLLFSSIFIFKIGVLDYPTDIEVAVKDSFTCALVSRRGSYEQIAEALYSAMAKINSSFVEHGHIIYNLTEFHALGVYGDHNERVNESSRRWWVGFTLPLNLNVSIDYHNSPIFKNNNLTILTVSKSKAYQSFFPWKSMVSPIFGARQVWPLMNKIHPLDYIAIEVYKSRHGIIEYLLYSENLEPLLNLNNSFPPQGNEEIKEEIKEEKKEVGEEDEKNELKKEEEGVKEKNENSQGEEVKKQNEIEDKIEKKEANQNVDESVEL